MLFNTAKRSSLKSCHRAVIDCCNAAFDLNSIPDPESRLTELVVKLANV